MVHIAEHPISDNIAAYGGDNENVTIFGESAGGWSVEALLSSEKTVGYFHKAIAQSGCLKCSALENPAVQNACMEFARNYFKVDTNDELKSVLLEKPIEEIIEFYKAVPMQLNTGFTGKKLKLVLKDNMWYQSVLYTAQI